MLVGTCHRICIVTPSPPSRSVSLVGLDKIHVIYQHQEAKLLGGNRRGLEQLPRFWRWFPDREELPEQLLNPPLTPYHARGYVPMSRNSICSIDIGRAE
jgi:hypothetical protein